MRASAPNVGSAPPGEIEPYAEAAVAAGPGPQASFYDGGLNGAAAALAPPPAALGVAPPPELVVRARRSGVSFGLACTLGGAAGLAVAGALLGVGILLTVRGDRHVSQTAEDFCRDYPFSFVGTAQACADYWGATRPRSRSAATASASSSRSRSLSSEASAS